MPRWPRSGRCAGRAVAGRARASRWLPERSSPPASASWDPALSARASRRRRRQATAPAPRSRGWGVRGAGGGLADLLALDLGMVWAGPWCGRLLAGLGARVVKIEGPARRDGTRREEHGGCAGAFADLNAGKESL